MVTPAHRQRLAILFFLLFAPACRKEPDAGVKNTAQEVMFATPHVGFGAVYGTKTLPLTIVNRSSDVVSVTNVQADCSCAKVLSPTSFDIPPQSEHQIQVQLHAVPGVGEIGSQLYAKTKAGQRLECYLAGVSVSSEGLAILNSPSMYSDSSGRVSGVAVIARDASKAVKPQVKSTLEKLTIAGGEWQRMEFHPDLEYASYELSAVELEGSGSFALQVSGSGTDAGLERKINWYAATNFSSNKGFWFAGTIHKDAIVETTLYVSSSGPVELQGFEGGDFVQEVEAVPGQKDLLAITVKGRIKTTGMVDKSLVWTQGDKVVATLECIAFVTD